MVWYGILPSQWIMLSPWFDYNIHPITMIRYTAAAKQQHQSREYAIRKYASTLDSTFHIHINIFHTARSFLSLDH